MCLAKSYSENKSNLKLVGKYLNAAIDVKKVFSPEAEAVLGLRIVRIEYVHFANMYLKMGESEKNYTMFTIAEKTEYTKYTFNMENTMFTGYWTGYFYPVESGGTKVVFTENINIKSSVVRIIFYLFWNLKKIQMNYIRDLKVKLGEDV